MAKKPKAIDPDLLDELLAGQDPKTVLSSEGLLGDLKKALAERILNAEMEQHLEKPEEQEAGNHRNGTSPKTVLTEGGEMDLSIPRDRHGHFEPALIAKYRRRLPGFDQKVIALYARGMSTREIQSHLRELYGVEISPELVSAVTDAVLDEVTQWQNRPLEHVYAIVFFDALRVKIRDEGAVKNKAVYLAIGVRCSGHKEVLGIWIEQTEGAKFSRSGHDRTQKPWDGGHPNRRRRRSEGVPGGNLSSLPSGGDPDLHRASDPVFNAVRLLEGTEGPHKRSEAHLPGCHG